MSHETLSIALLPALEGDCIHIIYTNGAGVRRHIVVDSGPAAFAAGFSALLAEIKAQGEQVDLLCFSHIDNDHIGGAEQLAVRGELEKGLIRKILFNIVGVKSAESEAEPGSNLYSAASASRLTKGLLDAEIPVQKRVISGMLISEADCTFRILAPDGEALAKLHQVWQMPLQEQYGTGRDQSITNGSSIAFVLEAAGKRLALLGDSTPEQLERGLKRCCPAGLHVDAVKLPHHGSGYNINENILKMIHTNQYLISTKRVGNRPDKALIELLYNHHQGKPITVYGNYPWWEGDFYTSAEQGKYIESGAIVHCLTGKEGILL